MSVIFYVIMNRIVPPQPKHIPKSELPSTHNTKTFDEGIESLRD